MTELAWAAGFFDGEGCTTRSGKAKGSPRHGVQVLVSQSDPACLERFQRAVSMGKVYGPYRAERKNPEYVWMVGGLKASWAVIRKLYPFLSEVKRDQAARIFAGFYLQPPPVPAAVRYKGRAAFYSGLR